MRNIAIVLTIICSVSPAFAGSTFGHAKFMFDQQVSDSRSRSLAGYHGQGSGADMNSESELDMIKLQQLMSQRQTAATTASNLLSGALGCDSQCLANIHG